MVAFGEILLNAAPRTGAIRAGTWKLIVRSGGPNDRADVEALEARKRADAKPDQDTRSFELFDLSDDPNEKKNLAPTHREKVDELLARYDELARQAKPPKLAPKPRNFRAPRVWGQPDRASSLSTV